GNTLVLCVILRHRKMRNLTNFFLANLAVADLCVGLFCIMQTLATQLSDYWHLGKVMCKLYFVVQVASYTASLLLLTLISVERYFAIIHPILSKRLTGMRRMRVAAVAVWVVSIAYSSPSLLAEHISLTVPEAIPNGNDTRNVTYEFCHDPAVLDVKIFVLVNFVLMYLVPLIMMTFVYTRISILLWKTSHFGGVTMDEEISPNSEELPTSRPGSILSKKNSNSSSLPSRNGTTKVGSTKKTPRPSNPFIARRKVIRLLIAVVVSFALCVLPHHIRLLIHIWLSKEKTHTDNIMVPVTFLIFYFNSCLNPFLYAFLSDNFRKAFREIVWFQCFRTRSRNGSAMYSSH
ncbi:hypothetical protein CAPTEDRAFT_34777, partial [Capitella teleta]|uniref:G-protein coupled receptors family 1 profile domain-containing protein n=1 Tax=Capitella teleta TaxID=283909 RepID=X2B324_CAPTE